MSIPAIAKRLNRSVEAVVVRKNRLGLGPVLFGGDYISMNQLNEPLDCRNYALAAFKALPKNLDEIDRQIKAASGVRVPAPPSANITPPKRRPAQRSRQKYYDDW